MNRLTKNLLLTLGMCALVSLQASAAGKKEKVNPIFDNYFKTPTEAVATPDADGFIRRWNLLEPIGTPNRSNTVFTDSYIREQEEVEDLIQDETGELDLDGEFVVPDGILGADTADGQQ